MTLNFPGPYEVRLIYSTTVTSQTIQHTARYNCVIPFDPTPGDLFSAIEVDTRDNTGEQLDVAIDAWVALIDGLYYNGAGAVSFDYAELWKYEEESYDASFISTYDIAVAGASAVTTVTASQVILTYRTIAGGVMKQSFMEGNVAIGEIDTPPYANTTLEAIRNFTLGGSNWMIGRDNAHPFSAIGAYPGQNEALFKRRFR